MLDKETFLQVFFEFNQMVFPWQFVFYIGALFMIFLVLRHPGEKTNQAVNLFLGTIWVFMGVFYHILSYAKYAPAGYLFGILFIAGGVVFFLDIFKKTLNYELKLGKYLFLVFSALALVIYEIIGYFIGHVYPSAPILSAPCPTTMLTLAFFILTIRSAKTYHFLVPLIWAIFAGLGAPKMFGIYQDYLLFLVGLIVLLLKLYIKMESRIKGRKLCPAGLR